MVDKFTWALLVLSPVWQPPTLLPLMFVIATRQDPAAMAGAGGIPVWIISPEVESRTAVITKLAFFRRGSLLRLTPAAH